MMTPERRAEIDDMLARNHDDEDLADALSDSVAEIDRLNKVVDQAIEKGNFSVYNEPDGLSYIINLTGLRTPAQMDPELAAELERRSKA